MAWNNPGAMKNLMCGLDAFDKPRMHSKGLNLSAFCEPAHTPDYAN